MAKYTTHKSVRDVPTKAEYRRASHKRIPSIPLTPAVARALAPRARIVGGVS